MVGGYVDEFVSTNGYSFQKECEHETHLAPIDFLNRHSLHSHTLFHSVCVRQDSYQRKFYPCYKVHAWVRLAESTSKTDDSRSQTIRQYLADIFGVPDFKTSWYDNIIDVEVAGDTATIKTNLSSGDEKLINICGVVSGFVYSHLNAQLGIRKVKILGSSGEVLVFRRDVLDDCPYKSSRNPGLQPPARQPRNPPLGR